MAGEALTLTETARTGVAMLASVTNEKEYRDMTVLLLQETASDPWGAAGRDPFASDQTNSPQLGEGDHVVEPE